MTIIGQPFIELSSIDSTNIYAMNQIHAHMATHGTCYLTHHQTNGKGQRGKKWHSSPHSNISMSVILQPLGVTLNHSFSLSAAIALACFELFNNIVGSDCSIKWPNDIYWRDRKAGGILIENVITGQNWTFSVAGIGLNVNQTDFPLDVNAVSLKQITGKDFDYTAMAKDLCTLIDDYWHLFLADPDQIIKNYNLHLYKRNSMVAFRKENRRFQATVKEITNLGELVLLCPDKQIFSHGSLEWLL